MTECITFLTDLKALGNQYLTHPLTRFKNKFKQSSSESQKLALALSKLNPSDPNALLDAVNALIQYIYEKKSYAYKRRFWDDYIFPKIIELVKKPLEDLSQNIKAQLQEIEFPAQLIVGTDFTRDSTRLLFDGMGYGKTPVERHPTLGIKLNTPEGCDEIAKQLGNPNCALYPYGTRILAYFLLQSNGPAPEKVKSFIERCLINARPKGLLLALKAIHTGHSSAKILLPNLLRALANTYVPYTINIFGTAETDYSAQDIAAFQADKIECLKELKRLGLGSLSVSQLRSLVMSVPAYFDEIAPSYAVVSREILSNPQWNDALRESPSLINLSNLLDVLVYPDFYRATQSQKTRLKT